MDRDFVQCFRLFYSCRLLHIIILLTCFLVSNQEELWDTLHRQMRYTPEDKNYIPVITLRRFLQFRDADDDPSYRRRSKVSLDLDSFEKVKIFYSKQGRKNQVFKLPGDIDNISKIHRADLIIQDYDHSLGQVRVHYRRNRPGKIARWTTEGYALNVTKRVHNHLQSGHKTIRFRVCVQHREHLRCRGFGKFTIALVIQINVHMDASYEFSTEHINLLDMYRDRDKYQIRTKRSENDERTETPNQNTGTPLNTHVETPHCHVHPWILNFTDIGWNNVLVPQSFDANVCVGGCPSPLISIDSLNSTYHSNVVDLYLIYHNMTANGIPPAPSCTATELAPLSIMYSEDDGSVGLIKLEGIKVVACGCR